MSEPTKNKDLIERMNQYYIFILQSAWNMDQSLAENRNMYLDAFFGLLRNGYPYTAEDIVIPAEEPEKPANNKKKKNSKEVEKEAEPISSYKKLTIMVDDVGYSCTDEDMRFAFGRMYDRVVNAAPVNSIAEALKDQQTKSDDSIVFIDVYGNEKKKKQKEKELEKEQKEKEKEQEEKPQAPLIPYFLFDSRYPNDPLDTKDYDTFLFHIHHLNLIGGEDGPQNYDALVYPLTPGTEDALSTDILVILYDKTGKLRTAISATKGKKSVSIEIDNHNFMFRGSWANGEFKTVAALLNGEDDEGVSLKETITPVIPTKRTSTFYLRHICKNGNVLNIFPLELLHNDNSTGLASAIVMLEDGKGRSLYEAGSQSYISLFFDGKQRNVSIYWSGNALHADIF